MNAKPAHDAGIQKVTESYSSLYSCNTDSIAAYLSCGMNTAGNQQKAKSHDVP